MSMNISRLVTVLAALLTISATGCGEDPDKPLLVPATGKVTFQGKGLTAGSIIFFPDRDAEYQKDSPSSLLQVDGSFTMKTFPFGDGVAPGKYKVCLSPALAGSIKLPDYADSKKTPWEVEITDTGKKDIVLEAK